MLGGSFAFIKNSCRSASDLRDVAEYGKLTASPSRRRKRSRPGWTPPAIVRPRTR